MFVAALFGALLSISPHQGLAQALELPPPEIGEETEKAPPRQKTPAAASSAVPSTAPSTVHEEEESAPSSAPASSDTHASTSHESTPAPATSGDAASSHDKATESGHSEDAPRTARPAGLGSGLIWFAAAFGVLVIAVFVFT